MESTKERKMTEAQRGPDRCQVGFRMRVTSIAQLDELCEVNKRSRREIVEILVAEAHGVWQDNPADRINPS
jgi:hypothetical protein